MQVFKTFMKVTKKRIPIASIYVIIFIAIGFLMSSNATQTTDFKATKLNVSIIDEDNTYESKALIEYIGKNHDIVEIDDDKDKILDALYYQSVDYVLNIKEGYSEKLAECKTEGLFSNYKMPNSYTGEFFDSQLDEYIKAAEAYITGGMTVSDAVSEAAKMADESAVDVEKVNFSANSNVEYSETLSYYYQYLAYILIAVIITGLCPTLLVFTQSRIKNRTNCSCISPLRQFFEIAAGTAIFVVGVYVLLTAAAFAIYGKEMFNEKGLLALLNGFVFLIFSMVLTMLISVLAPNTNVVNMIANTVSLGMSFLCGVFVPQSLLSDTVLGIGKFMPAYWYVKANDMLSGASGELFSMSKYANYVGIELLFSLVLTCAILIIVKMKRKSKSL